jgi:ABC-type antimicrobial peptide transport system permease subunit
VKLLRAALAGAASRRGRSALAALGVFAAAIVVGAATTLGYSLATGFDRAAERADLPHVLARFRADELGGIDDRVRTLPNLARREYRLEVNDVGLRAGRRSTEQGAVHVLLESPTQGEEALRRGYAVVAGRDLGDAPGEVLVERGLASEWGLEPGDVLEVGPFGGLEVVGVTVSPDNVAYPLARAARVYISRSEVTRRFGPGETPANLALLWLVDPAQADVTLAQARVATYGVGGLRFLTRDGVRVLLEQAGGVVIALLVAFSLVSLVAAATMLTAGAHAEVARRMAGFGVQRAIGFTPGAIAARQAAEAALVAIPAAALGLAAGALAVSGPSADLLGALNELSPGAAVLGPLLSCLLAIVALFTAASTWPAWRAARRPPVFILRGGDLTPVARRGRRALPAFGFPGLGARFAIAARGRWLAAVATVGVCASVVLLMLALASLLERLRDDPATLGKRYQLTARLPADSTPAVRAIPGVAAAAPRYAVGVADSYRLSEAITLVAYEGDHTHFEAPPLAEGRRIRTPQEVEVGSGIAAALGLRPGSTLAVQTPSGRELRFRVVGVVRALENDGRMAYADSRRLLRAEPNLRPSIAVALEEGADPARVGAGLQALGAPPQPVTAATTRNAAFLGILAAVLRGIGLAVGLVCLYALLQALSATARERRGALALLRASGADIVTLALVLAGAALSVVVPAGLVAVALEASVLSPLVARLAADFAALPLGASASQAALMACGLLLFALAAGVVVARGVLRASVVEGLRRE